MKRAFSRSRFFFFAGVLAVVVVVVGCAKPTPQPEPAGLLQVSIDDVVCDDDCAIDFGAVVIGNPTNAFVTAKNVGDDFLDAVVVADRGAYVVDSGNLRLAPGEAVTLKLRFSPQAVGDDDGRLVVGRTVVALSGSGVCTPTLDITLATLNGEPLPPNTRPQPDDVVGLALDAVPCDPARTFVETTWTALPPSTTSPELSSSIGEFTVDRQGSWAFTVAVVDDLGAVATSQFELEVARRPRIVAHVESSASVAVRSRSVDAAPCAEITRGTGAFLAAHPAPTGSYELEVFAADGADVTLTVDGNLIAFEGITRRLAPGEVWNVWHYDVFGDDVDLVLVDTVSTDVDACWDP